LFELRREAAKLAAGLRRHGSQDIGGPWHRRPADGRPGLGGRPSPWL